MDNPEAEAILRASGLVKRYGHTQALAGVSLSIRPGAIAALIGPNGAGKSTLIKCWLGFERPTGGNTAVAGHDPVAEPTAVLREIGYLAQGAPLYPDLTLREHLALARGLRPSIDVNYALARLEHLRIPQTIPSARLSGGQQAQVALAIVLATHPSILLLDEPLASLDPLARREFLNVLVDTARREGQTVLLSSHIVSDIEHVCDTVIVLADGRLLLASSTTEALSQHAVGPLDGVAARRIAVLPTAASDAPTALYDAKPIAATDRLRAPSVEELVLGYLASANAEGGLQA